MLPVEPGHVSSGLLCISYQVTARAGIKYRHIGKRLSREVFIHISGVHLAWLDSWDCVGLCPQSAFPCGRQGFLSVVGGQTSPCVVDFSREHEPKARVRELQGSEVTQCHFYYSLWLPVNHRPSPISRGKDHHMRL